MALAGRAVRDSQMLVAHVGNEGAVGRDGRVVKKKEARTMKEAAAQREAQLEAVRRTAQRGAGSPPPAQLAGTPHCHAVINRH